MYLVSDKLIKIPRTTLPSTGCKLPSSYTAFLETYGEGTYGGVLNVELPDIERMKDFIDLGFWIFDENIPITAQQLGECIALLTTIDGDIFAVHPDVDQLLLFPRHSDKITLFPIEEQNLCHTLDSLISHLYNEPISSPYFEPWNQKQSKFMQFKDGDFPTMSALEKYYSERFPFDFKVENEHYCEVFHKHFGGYVRFNYDYNEIAVFYDDDKAAETTYVFEFLKPHVNQ